MVVYCLFHSHAIFRSFKPTGLMYSYSFSRCQLYDTSVKMTRETERKTSCLSSNSLFKKCAFFLMHFASQISILACMISISINISISSLWSYMGPLLLKSWALISSYPSLYQFPRGGFREHSKLQYSFYTFLQM